MPRILLTGRMTCPPTHRRRVRRALALHLRCTRRERGCLIFDVRETAPGVFWVREVFATHAAFDAHQARARGSLWGRITAGLPRDYRTTTPPKPFRATKKTFTPIPNGRGIKVA